MASNSGAATEIDKDKSFTLYTLVGPRGNREVFGDSVGKSM